MVDVTEAEASSGTLCIVASSGTTESCVVKGKCSPYRMTLLCPHQRSPGWGRGWGWLGAAEEAVRAGRGAHAQAPQFSFI